MSDQEIEIDYKLSHKLNKHSDITTTDYVVHASKDIPLHLSSLTDLDEKDIFVRADDIIEGHTERAVSKAVHSKWVKDPACAKVDKKIYSIGLDLEDIRAAYKFIQSNPEKKDLILSSLRASKKFKSNTWRLAYNALFGEPKVHDELMAILGEIEDDDAASMLQLSKLLFQHFGGQSSGPNCSLKSDQPEGDPEGKPEGKSEGKEGNGKEKSDQGGHGVGTEAHATKYAAELDEKFKAFANYKPDESDDSEDLKFSVRKPEVEDYVAAARTVRALNKAHYIDRYVVETQEELPPGRLNGRAHVQQILASKADITLNPEKWRRRRRRKEERPPLKVGMAIDVSGSMGSLAIQSSKLNWIFAEAIWRIEGKFCSYGFGGKSHQLIAVNERTKNLKSFVAPGPIENINASIDDINTELGLIGRPGPRLLLILSDFRLVNDYCASAAKKQVRALQADGVHVLCLGYGSVQTEFAKTNKTPLISLPHDVEKAAELITGKCIQLLENA